MKIIFTKHAEEKLKRLDIKSFKINKRTIREILIRPNFFVKTKYGENAALGRLDQDHIIRVIYAIIDKHIKVITFHVARKGRYEN